MTFAARVLDNLDRQGDRIALRFEDRSVRFAALRDEAEHWRRFLDELEVAPGERVAFLLESSPALVALHLGNLLAGRISVPLNPRATAGELARMLEVARPALVVVGGASEAALREALARSQCGAHLLEERFLSAAFSAGGRSAATSRPLIGPDDPAMIVFTSGSTGLPKGATLSQRNLLAGIEALEIAWSLHADDHLQLCLPLFHVHGLGLGIHGMAAVGHAVTLTRGFDPEATLAALSARPDGPSLFYGVPTIYHRLVRCAPDGLKLPLRLAVSGSAPLAAELHQAARRRLGIDILERYGMSETLMLASNPLMGERRAGTVGLPLPGVELSIVDADGVELAEGEEGEIRVRGANVFSGYWGDDIASRSAFDDQGRFRTGDLGRIEADSGHLVISGRAKELIISGGFNVHPREVEEVLLELPGVRECAVVGLPDDDLGECVTAFVVPDPGFDRALVDQVLRERLSGYKRPRRIELVSDLPRNAMGKIQRHLLGEVER
ncbi:MAG: AMP-binding protein [Planctomycetes bacterium]|nr:AMP-binding protein [Planctomycetota bacterium]